MMSIVLVAEGVKPSSSLQLGGLCNECVDDLITELNCFGLFISYSEVNESFGMTFDEAIQIVNVSLCLDLIEFLGHLDQQWSECQISREVGLTTFGEVFGYPKTAINGFVGGEMIEEKTILSTVLSLEEFQFFCKTQLFRLSKDHWREESVIVKSWIDSFKNAAPVIYEEILSP